MSPTAATPSWVTNNRPHQQHCEAMRFFTPPCTSSSITGSSIPAQTTKGTRKITDFFCSTKAEGTNHDSGSANQLKVNKKTKTLSKQLFLDLGQPFTEVCKVCGMRYSQSFDVDIKLHTRFHKFYLKGITFPIKKHSKGCEMVGETARGHKVYRAWNSCKSSSIPLLKNLEQVVDLVNKEMEAAGQSRDELAKLQIFVCLKGDNQVVGLFTGSANIQGACRSIWIR